MIRIVETSVLVPFVALVAPSPAPGDVGETVRIGISGAVLHVDDGEFAAAGGGQVDLVIDSLGAENVRATLEVNASVADTVSFGVSRAFVRARFPSLRVTAGLARVSWGKGFLFNAGDVVFLPPAVPADLFATDFQIATRMMAAAYVGIGPVSFTELYLEPPAYLGGSLPGGIETARAGARIVGPIGPLATEAGYLYDGAADAVGRHRTYLALQVPLLGADLYASARGALSAAGPTWDEVVDSTVVSVGINRSFSVYYGYYAISARIEALLNAGGEWTAVPVATAPEYGIYLFPDLSVAFSATTGVSLRSLISPIDRSALLIAGINWAPLQGIRIDSFMTVMVGEELDQFAWGRPQDVALVIRLEYTFGER